MRAARWTTPSLRLRSVVTGTSQLPATFESNPTLLRPPLPSQCPTESREDILPHPVPHTLILYQSSISSMGCFETVLVSETEHYQTQCDV